MISIPNKSLNQDDVIINRALNVLPCRLFCNENIGVKWEEKGEDVKLNHNSVIDAFLESNDSYFVAWPNLHIIDLYGKDSTSKTPRFNLFPRYKKRSLLFPVRSSRRSIYEPTIIATKNVFNETVFYALPLSARIDYFALMMELLCNDIKNGERVLHYLCFGTIYDQNSPFYEDNFRKLTAEKNNEDDKHKKSPIANIAKHFIELDDPRRDQTKHHNLLDIIVIAICAIICGANHWTEMEDFGQAKHNWFKPFLELPNGIPSHDTFRRVFTLMDPEQFKKCFLSWVQSISQVTEGEVIAKIFNNCVVLMIKRRVKKPFIWFQLGRPKII